MECVRHGKRASVNTGMHRVVVNKPWRACEGEVGRARRERTCCRLCLLQELHAVLLQRSMGLTAAAAATGQLLEAGAGKAQVLCDEAVKHVLARDLPSSGWNVSRVSVGRIDWASVCSAGDATMCRSYATGTTRTRGNKESRKMCPTHVFRGQLRVRAVCTLDCLVVRGRYYHGHSSWLVFLRSAA
jgi:hypothetical protein